MPLTHVPNTKLQVRNWNGAWKLSNTTQRTDEKTRVILPSGHKVNQWQPQEENSLAQYVNLSYLLCPYMGDPAGPVAAPVSILKHSSHLTPPFWKLYSTVVKHKSKATSFSKSQTPLTVRRMKATPLFSHRVPTTCCVSYQHFIIPQDSPWQQEVRVSQSPKYRLPEKAGSRLQWPPFTLWHLIPRAASAVSPESVPASIP